MTLWKSTNWHAPAANGCAARARSRTSSSAAASAWPATWPTFPSSAGPASRTGPRSSVSLRENVLKLEDSADLDYVNVNELKASTASFWSSGN